MTSPASEDQAQAKVARYQIGEVADRTGVTQRTLRFYEEKGLLRPPERMDGGFRLYSDDDVQRIEYIRQLQQYLGFTLAEIKEMVEAEDLRQQIISTFRPDRELPARLERVTRIIGALERQLEVGSQHWDYWRSLRRRFLKDGHEALTDQETLEILLALASPKPRRNAVLAKALIDRFGNLAGVMGAKKTSDLIPLCHPLALSGVNIESVIDETQGGVRITAHVKTTGATGVEMEALTAVSVACLTLYDMLKAVDRGMQISDIRVTLKDGGKSGRYEAP